MRVKLILIIAICAAMALLVSLHAPGINGPWYWVWSWRRLPGWIYPAMLFAAAPFAAAQWAYQRGWTRHALWLLMAATLALELTAMACQPPFGLRRLPLIVTNTVNTSYWTDAKITSEQEGITLREILQQYPEIAPMLHVHAKYKPPGLLLYYLFWIKLLGAGQASAWAGGIGVALMAAAAPAACYALLKFYTKDTPAAFCGASYLALCPSLILFFPQFDQAYTTLLCLILLAWGKAARDGRWPAAIACGALLAAGVFCSYILLVAGCFIIVDWMLLLADRGPQAFGRATLHGALALVTVALIYGLFHALTGFDPIATYRSIAAVQMKDLIPLRRPFPRHILFDAWDFAMASGWISAPLVIYFLIDARMKLFGRSPGHRLALLALIQIVTVACAALLPGETARLWMLMLPLLMAPIGLELSRWPVKGRMVVYACLWLIMVVICRNMTFLYMGPELDGPRS